MSCKYELYRLSVKADGIDRRFPAGNHHFHHDAFHSLHTVLYPIHAILYSFHTFFHPLHFFPNFFHFISANVPAGNLTTHYIGIGIQQLYIALIHIDPLPSERVFFC